VSLTPFFLFIKKHPVPDLSIGRVLSPYAKYEPVIMKRVLFDAKKWD